MNAKRNAALVIRMARPDDRDGKSRFTVLAHQILLAGNLIPRILPMGIGKRGAFGDAEIRRRLMIGGSRADIDILISSALEQSDIPLDLFHPESDELRNHIKLLIAKLLLYFLFAVHIRNDGMHTFRDRPVPVSAVQKPYLPVGLLNQPSDNRSAYGTRTSDEQSFHFFPPGLFLSDLFDENDARWIFAVIC